MARVTGIYTGQVGIIRSGTGVIVADSATLTDANIDPTLAFSSAGLDSIFLGVEITGGTAPTMTIEMLFRDLNATDGLRWKRILLGAREGFTLAAALASEDSGALDGTAFVEMRTFGYSVIYPRIKAVANPTSTTAWSILAVPGKPRNTTRLNVG